jgi:hypothetical protein
LLPVAALLSVPPGLLSAELGIVLPAEAPPTPCVVTERLPVSAALGAEPPVPVALGAGLAGPAAPRLDCAFAVMAPMARKDTASAILEQEWKVMALARKKREL